MSSNPGVLQQLFKLYIVAMKERGRIPSSSRIYAGWLIGIAILIQLACVWTLLLCLMRVNPKQPGVEVLVGHYVNCLRWVVTYSAFLDVATALSFYGINVWKYCTGLRHGVVPFRMGITTPDVTPMEPEDYMEDPPMPINSGYGGTPPDKDKTISPPTKAKQAPTQVPAEEEGEPPIIPPSKIG